MRVVFFIGRADSATLSTLARACQVPGIEPIAVLIDTAHPNRQQRWNNLRRNIRREGLTYVFYRAVSMLRQHLEARADRIIPQDEVETLLRQAFPDRSIESLSLRYGFSVMEVENLNSPQAQQALRSFQADLGVVLGTRVLKQDLLSIPRLGCINLHKGKVPEYRGMPPGFWELYEQQESAHVTVHFVDAGLDTGDVIETTSVPIHPLETPESLRSKLNIAGEQVLASALDQLQQGTALRQPQIRGDRVPRTRPTRAQQEELARRLPHWRRLGDGSQVIKLIVWLTIFHSGLFSLIRWSRRGSSRGAILLYHRINDVSQDVLTANTRRFAEHIVALKHYYLLTSTANLVGQIAGGVSIPATSVAIHFDDCYRDVHDFAAPILNAASAPAVAFIASGFVDTDRLFQHDLKKYPHRFPNLRQPDLQRLPAFGVEIAAHTVNHVDLGSVTLEQASTEVVQSRQQLEQWLQHPVLLFSFPFGGIHNIREEVREMVASAGYRALFSAHGGFIGPQTSLFDIPRFGVSSDQSALALLMRLEGISPGDFSRWLRGLFKKQP